MTVSTRPAARVPGRFEVVLLGAVLTGGVVLRFVTRSHLWLDEALSVDIARLPLRDIPAALRQDGHPPLYYALLHVWMRVFGSGDTAVRALSGLFGVAALPLLWVAARRFGRDAAIAAVALVALSPFAIRYSTEARMYSLVMFLVLAGYLLIGRARRQPSIGRLVPVALVVGLLLLTHYWALWLTGAVLVVLGWQWRGSIGDDRRARARVMVAVALGGLLLLPWLPSMLTQSAHTGTPWAATVRPTTMIATAIIDVGGGDYGEAELLAIGLVLVFVLGLFGRAAADGRIELDCRPHPAIAPIAAAVGATFLIAIASSYASHTTFASRYVAVVFPLYLLVGAVGLSRIEPRAARGVVLLVLLVLGLAGGVHNMTTDRTQAGVIAAAIDERIQPSDLVIVCPDQLGPSMRRVLPSATLLTYPDLGDGQRVNWTDYEARNAKADTAAIVAEALARPATPPTVVWLVLSDSYKTLEGQCPAVQQVLSQRSGSVEGVIAQNDTTYFESAALLRIVLTPSL